MRTCSVDAVIWSSELAYAIGLIATDGNLSRDGRHISLTSSDVQQLENFRKCVRTTAKLSRNPPGSFTKKKNYRVQLSNKVLYQQLKGIGLFPNKTGSLGALQIPPMLFRDFLRGVIDGDGSILLYTDRYNMYKGKRYEYLRIYVTITSASLKFLEWVQATLRQALMVRGSLLEQPPRSSVSKPLWKLRFAKKDSTKILHWIYYHDQVPCLARKRVLAERALNSFKSFRDKRCKHPI